ncbi:MAG: hypothetical protein WA699_07655, partial [Pseudolabrys sp.]
SCRSGSEGVQLRQGPEEGLPQRIPWLLPDPAGAGLSWSHGGADRNNAMAAGLALYRPGVRRNAAASADFLPQ